MMVRQRKQAPAMKRPRTRPGPVLRRMVRSPDHLRAEGRVAKPGPSFLRPFVRRSDHERAEIAP